jgi:RNA polymerase sigma-70 factor (ECF subfamily)
MPERDEPQPAPVIPLLGGPEDWPRLIHGARLGDTNAKGRLFDLFAPRVRRILARLLGTTDDVPDLLHDVFAQVFRDIGKIKQAASLEGWITSIAVHVARGRIRRTARRRWLTFLAPEDLPDVEAPRADEDVSDAVRATYRVLERLAADERITFALRFIEGLQIEEIAVHCGVSLSTSKRRLRRASAAFAQHARQEPALGPWLAADSEERREGAREG